MSESNQSFDFLLFVHQFGLVAGIMSNARHKDKKIGAHRRS